MILVLTCQCGSVEQKARGFLKRMGYSDWLNIPIHKGREKSRKAIQYLPKFPEVEMLDSFLDNASKWVVILGYDGEGCKWSDIAHGGLKAEVDAEFVVRRFA